jgi:hypothetical protein
VPRLYAVTIGYRTPPPLAPGERAGPGLVGYLGPADDLNILNPGDSFGGTPFEGTATSWEGNTLVARGDNLLVERWRINAGVVFASGADPVMRYCVVQAPADQIFCVTQSGGDGTLTVEDTTVIGTPDMATLGTQVNGISSDARLVARRCDVSGSGDGIHAVAQPGSGFEDGSLISQCYIHDLSFINAEQHCDGIQIFQQESVETFVTVEHCWVDKVIGPGGQAMNASLTMGMPPSHNNEALLAALINNNVLAGGAFHLRIGYRTHNTVVTGNVLGLVDEGSGEFGLVAVEESSSVAVWSDNTDANGNPVENPNPP